MGFFLCGIGCLNLTGLMVVYKTYYLHETADQHEYQHMLECVAGYGLGGSTFALFARVGGGIFTKAADVGADLVGKLDYGLEEDSPVNPAVIADNVGDNVGDIAGMGADLFGSFAESTSAALVVSGTSEALMFTEGAIYYPVLISALGIAVCFICSFFATTIVCFKESEDIIFIQNQLKLQLFGTTALLTPVLLTAGCFALPETFDIGNPGNEVLFKQGVTHWEIGLCPLIGLYCGMAVGYLTEYYTSHSYSPVRDVSNASRTGSATNIISGLALGYESTIIPILCLAVAIFISHSIAGMFGIALATLGMISNLAMSLAIDGYGPIADNAGGIAVMAELPPLVRERTDCLDSAGNTTAAIGKGFAIGSACLVALALFGAFITRSEIADVNILKPMQFAGLLIGAMLPYAFSAMTMRAVGDAGLDMVTPIIGIFIPLG